MQTSTLTHFDYKLAEKQVFIHVRQVDGPVPAFAGPALVSNTAMNTLDELRSGALAGSRRLSLCCGLSQFPAEIFKLADTLEILDLSGNQLTTLPDDLARLHRLRIIFCSNNRFTELPAVLGQCARLEMVGFRANQISHVPAASLPPQLRWLVLTDNLLTALAPEIGRCTRLQKLMLSGNQLRALPPQMAACTNLELLRIAANQFHTLPPWLLQLPRLAWLAFGGNPVCDQAEAAARAVAPAFSIDWQQLKLAQQLGEGASGVIHQAIWQTSEGTQSVAVKLFKGAITSDGFPHSEMIACISAGQHASLVAVHGHVVRHPGGISALVLALIGPQFFNLAGPPSLASCTRDVYDAQTRFSLEAVLRLALGIASAAQQLHQRGILHGDLYGHNILCTAEGDALLTDFGAASFFALADESQAAALQRIEVRAFACLLEELLTAVSGELMPDSHLVLMHQLAALQARCANENTALRPLFSEISAVLSTLSGQSRCSAQLKP